MTYSANLGTPVTNTKLRTPTHITPLSGMCSTCVESCIGFCEIGLSATRGDEAIIPYRAGLDQFASEKDYPLDFSHFNINGRVFGAVGIEEDPYKATFPNAKVDTYFGIENKMKLKTPIILPALARLNWKDYFGGAALAGTLAVIGEAAVSNDPDAKFEDGKIVDSPRLKEMVESFKRFYHGYGDIVLQANYDDEYLGVLEYGIRELGIKTVELKYGQAAKGIQGFGYIDDLEKAQKLYQLGYVVTPNPMDDEIIKKHKMGVGKPFLKVSKLPMWNEDYMIKRVKELRELGAKFICFKTGPYDPKDLVNIVKISSKAGVDLITFDGGGGGTAFSPVKMMNEWGIPTVNMESMLYDILKEFENKGYKLPQIAIAGGFTMEDHVYKGLALAAPYVNFIGIARGAMAAAFSGKQIGEYLEKGETPKIYERFGSTKEEIFRDITQLREIYGEEVDNIPTGAIGVYSYINRINTGVQQLMALNRKFDIKDISRDDIVPLTELGAKVSGLKTYEDLAKEALDYI
jgi:hypothetical protein